VQLTFISLIDWAEAKFPGTDPWLTDRTIVSHVSHLRNSNRISVMSTEE
jgi:hypothetical protein